MSQSHFDSRWMLIVMLHLVKLGNWQPWTRLAPTTMKKTKAEKKDALVLRRDSPLATRTDLDRSATKDIAAAMNAILADVFALYLKTKNFHWHMSGSHFRDYHLLL